jgi:phage protein D
MVEGLREAGLMSDPSGFDRKHNKPYADQDGQLTVKAYEALEERLDRLPVVKDYCGEVIYRFEIDAQELAAKKQARADREAEMDRLRKEELEREREERAQARIAREAQNLAKLRDLFKTEGLADNWDDARLLAFADRIASVV